MTSLLDTMIEDAGGRMAIHPSSLAGRFFVTAGVGVSETKELDRVRNLIWRTWSPEDISDLVRLLSDKLRTPHGKQTLRPIQAIALAELHDYGGLLAPIGVSHGKALISLLAGCVVRASRPVLFIPAALRVQTIQQVLPLARQHWKIYEGLTIISYEQLQRATFDLNQLAPDLIILDEGHAVRDRSTARTKKLLAYLRKHPECKVVDMSGTLTSRSVKDYHHMAIHTLGEKNMPLPTDYHDLEEWSRALDEKVEAHRRIPPGALTTIVPEAYRFQRPVEMPETTYARSLYSLRLWATRGVVATDSSAEVHSSLIVREIQRPTSKIMFDALSHLRSFMETPDEDPIMTAVELWRRAREMACGFYYKWQPSPPSDWREVRRAWRKYVYETLKSNRRNLFSELMVANEILRHIKEGKETEGTYVYSEWKKIEKTFIPNIVTVWIDTCVVEACAEWLRKAEGVGLVWTEHVAFGEKLQEVSGYRYFGAGKQAAEGLLKHQDSAILSIAANKEGKNLQRWCRNLTPAPPPSGKIMEQLIGRTHRTGQEADEVTLEAMLGIEEVLYGFIQAKHDAHYIEDTTRMKQKLCFADYDVSEETRKLFGAPGISPAALNPVAQAAEQEQEQ